MSIGRIQNYTQHLLLKVMCNTGNKKSADSKFNAFLTCTFYNGYSIYSFDFLRTATTATTRPLMTKIGASVILRKLKMEGSQIEGSDDPPPAIQTKPIKINAIAINIKT